MPDPTDPRPAAPSARPAADDNTVSHADEPSASHPGTAAEPRFAAPAHAGEVGTFGRYRVLQKLGQGGMGAVYLGYDAALDRKVALKVMLPGHAADPASRDRFLREARSAAKVRSDHVVTIHDVGEERGAPFIAMEYLLGAPLDQFLKTRGELPLGQVLRVGREVALGLAAAHELGLVHRDVKPGNIWLEAPKGRVKLLDFGLARAADDDEHLTGSGAVVGSPAYMSPEQGRGLKVDHRTDLFSLGVLLYRLTTGKMPFTGAGAMAVLTSLAVDTPAAPRALNPQLPEAVEAVITRLLAKDPAGRFQTAWEVADALERVAVGPLPAVVAVPVPLAVGAQTQNVWEGIDDSHSVAVPLADDAETEGARPARPSARRATSRVPALAAAAAVVLAAGAVAAVALWPKKKPEVAAVEMPVEPLRPVGTPSPPKPGDKGKAPLPTGGEGTIYELPVDLIPPMTPLRPKEVFSLDRLDPANPKHIPPEEKLPGQPTELVAVLGSHRQRIADKVLAVVPRPAGSAILVGGERTRTAIDADTRQFLDWPPLACFSADGARGAERNRVWDLTGPKPTAVEYPIPAGEIRALLAGGAAFVAHDDGTHAVWKLDPKGPQPLKAFRDVFAAAAAADGTRLAVVGTNRACCVYDISDGLTERFTLPEPAGKVFTAGFPASRADFAGPGLLATVDPEGAVRVWDVSGAAPRLLHTVDERGPAAVALFPDGTRVVRATDDGFAVWSLDAAKPQKLAAVASFTPFGHLRCLAVTPDGGTIVTGHADGTVRFWGFEKGVIFERNPIRPQPIVDQSGGVSPDGRFAVLRHEDGAYHLWDLSTLSSRPVGEARGGACFGPNGTTLCVPTAAGTLRLITPAGPAGGREFGLGHIPRCFSPDGQWLATSAGGELAIWDVSVSPPKERFDRVPGLNARFWRFSPDGQFLVAATASLGSPAAVRVWSMTLRGPRLRHELDTQPLTGGLGLLHAALSPDGTTFVSCNMNGGLGYFDLKAGVLSFRRKIAGNFYWAEFSPDGSLVLAVSQYGTAVWSVATDKPALTVPLDTYPYAPGRFHTDGRHVLVTNSAGTTYVLRLPKEVLDKVADADRRAAEWVLSVGGAVSVNGEPPAIKDRAGLPPKPFVLTSVVLAANPKVTDADLPVLAACAGLRHLTLNGTAVTDAGLAHFAGCKRLTILNLSDTRTTDAGLAHFKGCPEMTYLHLSGTQVGDAGLAYFKDAKSLNLLEVRGTKVTAKGVQEFSAARPGSRIEHDGGIIAPKR